jgi:DNA polymerase Ligase (LigD)
VILEHDHPFPHVDFMIECGDRLRSWRLLTPPAPGETIAAEAIGDHRNDYLDYEGPVSRGRGHVKRWDAGTFSIESDSAGELRLKLSGGRVNGTVELRQVEGGAWNWRLERT